jgi:hypothetical protein
MASDTQTDQRQNWRKAFTMIGPKTLRLRMETRRGEYGGDYGREAELWLLEQDEKAIALEAKRYRTIRLWAIIAGTVGALAAIAAWIAAWPIIIAWFR